MSDVRIKITERKGWRGYVPGIEYTVAEFVGERLQRLGVAKITGPVKSKMQSASPRNKAMTAKAG